MYEIEIWSNNKGVCFFSGKISKKFNEVVYFVNHCTNDRYKNIFEDLIKGTYERNFFCNKTKSERVLQLRHTDIIDNFREFKEIAKVHYKLNIEIEKIY